jgi:hypothetical protein
LLSMNGPSVSSVRSPSERSVVADASELNRAQPVTFGRRNTEAMGSRSAPIGAFSP